MSEKIAQSYAILRFLRSLDPGVRLPAAVEILNPYENPETWGRVEAFYHQYFNDRRKRRLLLGINPGRFGAGITGIAFTDPVQLAATCGIAHSFPLKPELSSGFIYQVIEAYGGPRAFYSKFYISAVSPLGFVRGGTNLNYYDDPRLAARLRPFIVESIRTQQAFTGGLSDFCFCIGEGKNYDFFRRLNEEFGFYENIIPLPHPRWVMQYRRRQIDHYVDLYLQALGGS